MRLLTRARTFPLRQLVAARVAEVGLGRLLAVAVQLGLVLLVVYTFQVEAGFGFLRLAPLIFFGFVLHAVLPLRWRLPFFVGLSLAGIGVVLGFPHNVGLVIIGLGLIAICHLPIAFWKRVALLLGAGALLVALRAEWIETSWASLPTLVLPVLGAMFMFRLIIYLYDLRHEKTPASIWERLAYFFMLPNVCFLLFPVVDYQTFRRTYYNADSVEIYQKGVLWMYRGVVHLLLYRLVYYHLIPSPAEVEALGGVVQSMLTTYLLYLRISGQFHLIIGILCLFGFNLPETHHLYFLASSFNDYWRRINIYWKDFMMKIFYFPSLMALRRWGMTPALIGATVIVFFGTWALHSYQWFWLRGTFPVTGPDALFWGILGGLVVVNSLYEAKRSRKRSLSKQAWSARAAFVHAAKTVGMFTFICILWSLWSSPSVSEWFALLAKTGQSGATGFGVLALVLLGLVLLGTLVQYLSSRGWQLTLVGSQPSFARAAWATSLGALLLLVLGQAEVQARLGPQASTLVASLQEERLNQQDEETMERGYYEGLLNAESYTSALWATQVNRPRDWEPIMESEAIRPVDGVLVYELRPSYEGLLKETPFTTNRWGLRDRHYTKEKPPGTFRIALLGSSYAMGAGVEADQTFEALVEERLNREHAGASHDRYEILNFSVGGYSVAQNVAVAREKIFAFEPDLVFFIAHSTENRRLRTHLTRLIQEEKPATYRPLRRLIEQTDLSPEDARTDIHQRLSPYLDEIIRWSFNEIAAACQKQGVAPVWLFVPTTDETDGLDEAQFDRLSRFAQEAGFVVLSLEGAYGDHDKEALQLAAWDEHLSATGHRLVADQLYEVLRENDHHLQLGLSTTTDDLVTN